MQSPSSINTYFQCPRKYYFIYNLKMPTSPSIHLVRGSVAHLVLENLFEIVPEVFTDNFQTEMQVVVLELFKKYWNESSQDLAKVGLLPEELDKYYQETQLMLLNWLKGFIYKIDKLIVSGMSFIDAWKKLKPETEIEYRSEELFVRGYIDAIEKHDGEKEGIRLMDYKTSKRPHITKEYRLQLGIYALMYELKHGIRPDKVGIYFLKENEQVLDVDDDLIQNAKFMIEQIHMSTDGVDDLESYPRNETPLCKWSSGQCDFYDYCFKGKKIPDKPLR